MIIYSHNIFNALKETCYIYKVHLVDIKMINCRITITITCTMLLIFTAMIVQLIISTMQIKPIFIIDQLNSLNEHSNSQNIL